MKLYLPSLLGFSLLPFFSAALHPIAIGFEVSSNLPAIKDEFVKSEKNIITADKERKLEIWVKEAMKDK